MSNTSSWTALRARLDNVKKPEQTFRLCEDSDLHDRYHTAKREAARADEAVRGLDKDAAPEVRAMLEQQAATAATALTALRKEYDKACIVLRFAALDRKQLEDLQNAHPALEEDEAAGDDWHMDTFAPALISAASLDGMPAEDARHFLDTWAPGDARDLWNAAWSIQHTRRTDLGKD